MALQFSSCMAMPTTKNPHLQRLLHFPPNTAFLKSAKFFKHPFQNRLKLHSSLRRGLRFRVSSSPFSSSSQADEEEEEEEEDLEEALNKLRKDIVEAFEQLPANEEEEETPEISETPEIKSGYKPESEDHRPKKMTEEEVDEALNKVLNENLDSDKPLDKYQNLPANDPLQAYFRIDFAWMNVFAERIFGGNPTTVCYIPDETDSKRMQKIAREFNLSETAFLIRRRAIESYSKSTAKRIQVTEQDFAEFDETGNSLKVVKRYLAPPAPKDIFYLRWFTPKFEVDLGGHATLAAAHLLFETGIVEGDTVIFYTKSGILKARKVRGYDEPLSNDPKQSNQTSRNSVVELDFPLTPIMKCESAEVEKLADVLGNVEIVWAGISYLGDFLVEVPSYRDVKLLKPKFEKMLQFQGRGGLIVTSAGDPESEFDFISRYFCPKAGIQEDPVTGSSHCALGPYWAEKLQKHTLEAYQASERGGRVTVIVNKGKGRVQLQGRAMILMIGKLKNCHVEF